MRFFFGAKSIGYILDGSTANWPEMRIALIELFFSGISRCIGTGNEVVAHGSQNTLNSISVVRQPVLVVKTTFIVLYIKCLNNELHYI